MMQQNVQSEEVKQGSLSVSENTSNQDHSNKIQSNQQIHQIIKTQEVKQMPIATDKLENADKLKKQYYDFFKNIISNPEKYVPEMPTYEEFKRHKIKLLYGNQFHQMLRSYHQPYIRVKNTERQGTIVNYIAIISMFELEITLLNVKQKANEYNWQKKMGQGSFGSVRIQSQNKRMFAVKRQMFRNKYHLKEFNMMANKYEIDQAIKQLAIYKICSLFKIGPAAETDIGFDLICYRDCIEFQIQYCMKIEYSSRNDHKKGIYVDTNKFEKQIKQCLLTLHFFRIIHKDIKPGNILFSIKYNKYVLTDFGISHPVIQKIGYRSITHCEGTPEYMSDQIIKVSGGLSGQVDLYGNDLHSLSITLKKQINSQTIEQQSKQFTQTQNEKLYQNKYEYEYLKLKYYCIKPDSKMGEVQSYWKFMNINTSNQLIGIVDKSIEYNKIKNVYNYLSKQYKFQDLNLDSLRIQSQSIKSLKIEPNIKQNTQLQLKNMLRVYGYSLQVKKMIMKLKLQQKYKSTLKIIHKVLDKDHKINQRDRMFGEHRNYIKKVKKQLQKFQQQQNNQQVFKRYMIILQYGNLDEKLDMIQKLNELQYERKLEERIQQMIRVNYIEMNKQKLRKFGLWMDQVDQLRDNIISLLKLNHLVGMILEKIGNNEKALEYYKKDLNMQIILYGQHFPDVAAAYNNIADIYDHMGKYEIALEQYTKSLNIFISFYGHHPNVAREYNNIANIYNKLGKYERSLEHYTTSLSINISFHGQQHPTIARIYNNIAHVYDSMGKYETALTYYTKSLNILISFHGQQDPSIATVYNNIAHVYDSMGKYETALTYYTKSLNIDISYYGQLHPNIARTYNNIATVYNKIGNYETALTYYTKSLNMDINFHGQQHPNIARTYNNIASVYYKMGNYETALTYYTKSLNMDITFHGQQHPNIAGTYNNIACNYFLLANLISAHKYLYKSISVGLKYSMATQSPLIANNYHTLSHIFLKKTKYPKSLHYAFFALDTFILFNPLDHPQSPSYISLLAKIYYEMNRFIQSYFFCSLSCQILVRYFPIHHTKVRNAKHMMNEMEWSIPQSIHNYTSNTEFMNNINNKYSQLPKHKLIKLLFAKKWQLRFEQQHRSRRDSFEYLKCVIQIFLCYKYLGYLREQQKIRESIKKELQRFQQSQQKSIFSEFIKEISIE